MDSLQPLRRSSRHGCPLTNLPVLRCLRPVSREVARCKPFLPHSQHERGSGMNVLRYRVPALPGDDLRAPAAGYSAGVEA